MRKHWPQNGWEEGGALKKIEKRGIRKRWSIPNEEV